MHWRPQLDNPLFAYFNLGDTAVGCLENSDNNPLQSRLKRVAAAKQGHVNALTCPGTAGYCLDEDDFAGVRPLLEWLAQQQEEEVSACRTRFLERLAACQARPTAIESLPM